MWIVGEKEESVEARAGRMKERRARDFIVICAFDEHLSSSVGFLSLRHRSRTPFPLKYTLPPSPSPYFTHLG